MTRSPALRTRRAGFTLVEVLVVIAIIGVLVSLTAAAVFKIIVLADEVIVRKDMSDFTLAIGNYQVSMNGVGYIPSRFRLREDLYYYTHDLAGNPTTDQLDIESWSYLKKLFPKLPTPSVPNQVLPIPGVINWIGDPSFTLGSPPAGGWPSFDLEGHQCLIFFLGGIPAGGPRGATSDTGPFNCLGFSTNPTNPAQPGGDRIGPFYGDFKSDRLVIVPTGPVGVVGNVPPASQNFYFFSYLDAWGRDSDIVNGKTPVYGYLSSYGKTNGYNRYLAYYQLTGAGLISDCSSLTVEDYQNQGKLIPGLWPYALKAAAPAPPQYVNSISYQLFSAGPNRIFGEGTRLGLNNVPLGYTWSPQTAGFVSPLGKDDLSNFHDRPLGSGD